MRWGVLGPLEVRRDDGTLVDVPGAKERLLLALLAAASPDVVSVDRLAEQLWDGTPPRSARKSLQAHVVRLRTALEPDRPVGSPGRYVVRRGQGYALVVDRDGLDLAAFTDRVARGRALLSVGDVEDADALLREALSWWRGTPFVDWPDTPDLARERLRLEGIRGHALEAWWSAELALGRHAEAVPELRRLVEDEPVHEGWWALLATALYRAGRQGAALDALRRARGVLAEELGVDPGPRLRELEQAVLAQDPVLDLRPPSEPAVARPDGTAVPITGCPYKGLATYGVDDAAVFHGRDRLVRTLVTALVDHRVVLVSGSSGAGKSSVVRAGLLPALGSDALPGSARWRPYVVVPGERPVDSLAPLTGQDSPEQPVVLVCDQLEQLWSPGVPAGERVAFLDGVLGLVDDGVVARCVLVVRGDHVGRLAEHGDLARRMLGALVMVPPMTEVELRDVVAEPARSAGLAVEGDLTDVAVRDVVGRSGALPLLSTALAQTWERRREGVLTLSGYLASGGVVGAVARSAEQVYATLTDDEREQARWVMVRLAEQDPDGTLRARRLSQAELDTAYDPAGTRRVVEALVTARLVARAEHHLEVAHEALLGAWPRLAGWLGEDAVGRSVRRHLAPAALEWHDHGRPSDELFRGARLEAAAQWAAAPGSGASEVEREFVEAGLALADAELTAARERAEAEAAGRRRTRRFAGLLAAVLVLALVATGVAVLFERRADERAADARAAGVVADANRLAALSASARSLDVSLLLAAAAVQTADTPATRDGLLDTLVEHRRADRVYQLSEENVEHVALSADGRTLAAGIGGGSARVVAWRPGSAEPPRQVLEGGLPDHVAVSPDGDTVAFTIDSPPDDFALLAARTTQGEELPTPPGNTLGGFAGDLVFTRNGRLLMFAYEWSGPRVGYRSRLQQVDVGAREATQVVLLDSSGRGGRDVFFESSFADDGSAVVSWTTDHRRAFWTPVVAGRSTPLRLESRAAASVEFVATPTGALQFWSDGAVTRYDARGRAVQVLDVHEALVRDAAVLPDGRAAVTVGDGGQVELWSVDPRTGDWTRDETLVGHAGAVQQVEVSPDAGALLTASRDGQLISWDLSVGAGFGRTYPGLTDRWVSNRVQVVEPGRLVVAPARSRAPGSMIRPEPPSGAALDHGPGTASVAAVFWDPRDGRVLDEVVVGDTATWYLFGSSVAVSPDRRFVAVTSGFGTTVLDTRTRERVARIPMPQGRGTLDAAWCVSWTPDGSRLLIGAEGRTGERAGTIVVDTESWKVTRPLVSDTSMQVMEWSEDGSVLAAGVNYLGRIDLYDPDLRRIRSVDLGEGGDVFDLAFSPDGTMLAAARVGGGVTVLDTRSWRPVHETATMHSDIVLDVEWLPDGDTVVSTGVDEVVSLYDVDRDLVRSRPLPTSEVRGRGVSYLLPPSADEIVVVNQDGPGYRYPLDPARWLAEACTVAGRDLTRAEWERYLPGRDYRPVCDLSDG